MTKTKKQLRAEAVDEHDTREKLEADVRGKVVYSPMVDKSTDAIVASVGDVIGWLDRQAAITERECGFAVSCDACLLHNQNAELQAKVDELEADARACERCEADMAHDMEALRRENAKLSGDELHWHDKAEVLIDEVNYYQRTLREFKALLDGVAS